MDEALDRFPVRAGDVVGGKYRVDRVIGAGGMGVVVAATHTELAQPVALKFILPTAVAGRDAIERFLREARSIARLRSEHVARVFDVGRDAEDRPYMVLELLEGHDLGRLNKQKGPFPVADTVEYLLQACAGLVEAHAAGIIHRDLKPQNLFVTRRMNGTPLVKLLDFGIAKSVGAAAVGQVTLTDSKAVIGSPLYMPPEQMRSARTADVRSDIWSMGVMLYELLGGQLPFDGETVTEICVRVVNESPTSLLTLRPGLDPKLVEIVMRCLEKRPDARWQNVGHLGAALEPYARSSQQGAMNRPWQSFEETMDSVDIAGSSSSPVTTQRMTPSTQPPIHAQTDVTWGEHAHPSGAPSRKSSFASGLAVGVILSLGAIGAAVAVLVPRLLPRDPVPAIAVPPTPSAPAVTSSVVPAEPAPPQVTTTPSSTPSAVPTAKRKKPAITPTPVASGTAASAPAPPPPPAPEPPKQDAPNGAPILR